ncbi:MAG: hypothetical protein JJ971_01955 [Balneolaceae bacterium]|nr:hypothetical protein [Balneolaceae bacterium]MBO6545136.1 hypothetical protein [Balneolaceae bacterium]MBO6646532.1 hypothetical protein [Balneolaceae bacterium]
MQESFKNIFSAAQPALGYLYQCRLALSESLKRIPEGEIFTVSIETLDDVVFESDGNPLEILQAKHHTKFGDISDSSVDLWKTVRIWCDLIKTQLSGLNSYFYLVTTQKVKDNSILELLKEGNENNHQKIISGLDSIANTSENKTNKKAYEAYLRLSNEEKNTLISSIKVIDQALSIIEIEGEIQRSLFYAAEEEFLEKLQWRLEGWWFQQVVLHLMGEKPQILSDELTSKISELREQFKQENLPVDDDILSAEINRSEFEKRTFVQQLNLIEVSDKRIFYAIRNFYRAFEQRSRWIREDLLHIGELDRYEDKLVEDWEIKFEQSKDELGESASEIEKKKTARKIYEWIESGDLYKVRPGIREDSISRGSYHMLSDELKVGWHVEFRDRIEKLIGEGSK